MQTEREDITRRRFGRFQLLLELQRGGMATIFVARIVGPEDFQKLVVVKRIHDHLAEEREFVDMFHDEARIAGLVHHPNVVTIFDFGMVEGSHYIAMEYVHGQSLVELMRTAKRVTGLLPWPQVVKIVADAAAGLHAAHVLTGPDGGPLNVVHRDVSPQNILLSYDGNVKVTDFGIAYAAQRIAHTSTGILKGKLAYMSPEQAMSKPLDRRSDVFSLGIVLHEALCLKRLFKGDNDAATLYNLLEAKAPRVTSIRPDVPKELDRVVQKALAKNPDERFASAGEFEDALNQVLFKEQAMVGHRDIGELMERYFRDQRQVREAQLQQAMSTPMAEPVRVHAARPEESSMGSLSRSEGMEDGFRRVLPLSALVGAGIAVLALVGLFVLMMTRSSGSSASKVKSSVPTTRPVRDAKGFAPDSGPSVPRKPRKVHLTVDVSGQTNGVTIQFRGKVHKTAHLDVEVEPSSKPEDIVVKSPGVKTRVLRVVPDRDRSYSVDMVFVPVRPSRPFVRRGPRRVPRRSRPRMRLKPLGF